MPRRVIYIKLVFLYRSTLSEREKCIGSRAGANCLHGCAETRVAPREGE
jgi:hypothetical protein